MCAVSQAFHTGQLHLDESATLRGACGGTVQGDRARWTPRGFFYNSMLEQGWPGVKFHAPALKLQERNVYMRSLSNLLRRKGTDMDEEEARMNTVSGSKSRRRSADREPRGGWERSCGTKTNEPRAQGETFALERKKAERRPRCRRRRSKVHIDAVICDRITRVRRVAKSSKNGVLDAPHL